MVCAKQPTRDQKSFCVRGKLIWRNGADGQVLGTRGKPLMSSCALLWFVVFGSNGREELNLKKKFCPNYENRVVKNSVFWDSGSFLQPSVSTPRLCSIETGIHVPGRIFQQRLVVLRMPPISKVPRWEDILVGEVYYTHYSADNFLS